MFSKSIELLVDGLKAKGAAPEAGRTSKKKPPAR